MRNGLFRGTFVFMSGLLCNALAEVPTNVLADAASAAQAQAAPQPQPGGTAARDLFVTVGKSLVLDSPVNIQRVSVANGDLAEATAVSPREVLVNGKAPGETSLILWQQSGNRLIFDLHVRPSTSRLEGIRRQMDDELKGQNVTLSVEDNNVFVRGTVKDLVSAERAVAIASTLGKPVNLLYVNVPATDAQILIKVKFANVDRAATSELGANWVSTGAGKTPGRITTQQFGPPSPTVVAEKAQFNFSDALNILFFRPDLDFGATIKALQSRRLLEILAEPNVLTISGKPASFLAGGEFPYPTLQGGGGGLGAVTIQFREFGVRINFLPNVTPRGTIRMQVTPEVSSLDFANGLIFQGFTIPGLATRRVQTEVELESGQSFAIGGLLDNRLTESLNKIPGLGDIPLFGKLFQSRSQSKNNTELLILVTPELVRPIPAGQPLPEVKMPKEFLKGVASKAPRTPGMDVTGPVPVTPAQQSMPVEQLIESQKRGTSAPAPAMPPIQFVPVPIAPVPSAPSPSPASPAPAAPGPGVEAAPAK